MRLTALILVIFASAATADEPRELPFADVYATSPQPGMNAVSSAMRNDEYIKAHGPAVERILRQFRNAGSNLFLVQGESDVEAIEASERAFNGYVSTNRPVAKRNYHSNGTHWLVAYLGSGSSSSPYVIESVIQDGNRIRVSYRIHKSVMKTTDVKRYMFWIRLGKLEPGNYNLELYDAEENSVMLMRRVNAGPRNPW